MDLESLEDYEIPLRLFLPAFTVRTNLTNDISFNNEGLFTATWVVDDNENSGVQTVLCKDLVDSWTDMVEG